MFSIWYIQNSTAKKQSITPFVSRGKELVLYVSAHYQNTTILVLTLQDVYIVYLGVH